MDFNEEIKRGQEYMAEVHKKMTRVAQEFAAGEINSTQFHTLYDRYQRQVLTVAQLIAESDPSAWHDAVSDDEADTTLLLKQSLSAKIIGFSVYNNESSMPIETEGEFSLDAELIVPMLSSYRSATAEIFQSQARSTQLENGHWLYFISGQNTTLIVLFSLEPSANQYNSIKQIHRDYEIANEAMLKIGKTGNAIALPFFSLIGKTNLISLKLKEKADLNGSPPQE